MVSNKGPVLVGKGPFMLPFLHRKANVLSNATEEQYN